MCVYASHLLGQPPSLCCRVHEVPRVCPVILGTPAIRVPMDSQETLVPLAMQVILDQKDTLGQRDPLG